MLARRRPELVRRGVGGILDRSVDVLVAHFGVCVGLAWLCWLPFQLLSEIVLRADVSEDVLLFAGSLDLVPRMLTTSLVCSVVGAHLLGEHTSAAAAIRRGLGAVVGVAVISVFSLVLAGVFACLCCVVGGFVPMWLFSVAPVVYVLEPALAGEGERRRRGPLVAAVGGLARVFQSIGRSVQLVLGWDFLGRYLGCFLVANYAIAGPLILVPGFLQLPGTRDYLRELTGLGGGPADFLIAVIASIFVSIGSAYMAIVATVFYLDVRVRKEGLDLETRLARLAAHAPAGP